MKISELAASTNESIPTIKYYIRVGLLPAGNTTRPNQASYGKKHAERLKLIRVLREELSMSVDSMVDIFSHQEDGGRMLTRGLEQMAGSRASAPSEDWQEARAAAEPIFEKEAARQGWIQMETTPAYQEVLRALSTLQRAFPEADPKEYLGPYIQLMQEMARLEIPEDFDPGDEPWEGFRRAILGTYLFEPLILALRKYAHAQRACALAQGAEPPPE